LYIKEQDGITFTIDPGRLPDVEFPIYGKNGTVAYYYAPSGKTVFIPIKYRFKKGATDEAAKLEGQLVLPKNEPAVKACCNIPMDIIFGAFIYSRENDTSLLGDSAFARYADTIAEYLLNTLIETSCNFICMKKEYKYPSFAFIGNKLIAISSSVKFHEGDDGLIMQMHSPSGPYIAEFGKKKNDVIKVVILDNEGEKITEVNGEAKVDGSNIKMIVQNVIYTGTTEQLEKCQDIYDRYQENYISYFIDKTNEEEEVNEFEIFRKS